MYIYILKSLVVADISFRNYLQSSVLNNQRVPVCNCTAVDYNNVGICTWFYVKS